MIRTLFWFFIIFSVAILFGLVIKSDPGYVLIAYHHWTAEMPLWFAVIVILLAFILWHYTIRVIISIKNLRRRWERYATYRDFYQSLEWFEAGVLKLVEQDWRTAENLFIKGVSGSKMPLAHYLMAAYAAKKQSNYDRQDEYLYQAHDCHDKYEFAISLIQARAQMDQRQWGLARATLNRLQQLKPKHFAVLQLLKRYDEQAPQLQES